MPHPREYAPQGKVRYAAVGLGWITQAAFLPAFANAKKNSELTALVSDDPKKLEEIGDEYDVELRYNYDQYEQCLDSGKVDAVYIGLPNNMHREYTERAARAGVHVLCEKPMANTEEECRAMIAACGQARVKLMIAYRLHLEEANMKAAEVVNSGEIGEPRFFSSEFTEVIEDPGNIRLVKELGGGPLNDIGIYCINAARYLFRDEPIEAVAFRANSGDPKFRDVDEMIAAILRFPKERLAQLTVSFGAAKVSTYRVVGTEGDLRMDRAYSFQGKRSMTVTIGEKAKETTFKERDQFAAELLYFSDCVLEGKEPEPSGLEGLADLRIINALHRSAESGGMPVKLDPIPYKPKPTAAQVIKTSAPSKPDLVHASDPSGTS